ncbi:RCC1 domain-containing protein [Streptomyces sp. DK15]|uniref:RCC1-like domain-containing protein n=1 Tax=unclassified Streptomyces TaxID=2593676 RepID=UPI0034DF380E
MNDMISSWGCNNNGELGHGHMEAWLTPGQVPCLASVTHAAVCGDVPFAAPCTPRLVHTTTPPSGRSQRHLRGTVFA